MSEMLNEIRDAVAAYNENHSEAPAPQKPKKKHRFVKGLGVVTAGIIGIAVATQAGGGDDGSTYAEDRVASSSTKAEDTGDKDTPKVEMTTGQEQAVASAMDYLEFQAFSKAGLEQQLSAKYGEGFSKADAQFAVNHIDVDWNEQAVAAAKDYLEFQSFSKPGLIEQLESKWGDRFTHEQAVHGANAAYK